MERDKNGRFSKKAEEGTKLIFDIPPIKKILIWLIIFGVLLPWMSILSKFDVLTKILNLFDDLMNPTANENGNAKKGSLFG